MQIRTVISTTEKRRVYGIRFTAVFYASTIFPAAENRGTISRLTRETGGIVRLLPLERNAGYAIRVPNSERILLAVTDVFVPP